jgi:hypothetical protein
VSSPPWALNLKMGTLKLNASIPRAKTVPSALPVTVVAASFRLEKSLPKDGSVFPGLGSIRKSVNTDLLIPPAFALMDRPRKSPLVLFALSAAVKFSKAAS